MPHSPALRSLLLPLVLAALCPAAAGAVSLPVSIDGSFTDWTPGALVETDPMGDGGASGIDFTGLSIANDDDWVYLRFDTGVEVQPDEQQNIVLALDTDVNAATGLAVNGIGAELVWNLGSRTGTFYAPAPTSIGHADLGLAVGPTVSGTEFELALDRHAEPDGPLFPGNAFRVVLKDNNSGDVLVFGEPGSGSAGGYPFAAGAQPVPSLPLDRASADHVRIAGYNVENDGLFAGGSREAAQNRLFDAVDPDVWVICEVWSHSAIQVAAQVEELLPSGPGESWSAVRLDGGNAVVSRYPVVDSWLINPGDRLTAVLLDLRPDHDTDLLVVANHWSCCTADANRQRQADALVAFLRDARTPGGVIDLAADTPVVACGDFNLVGWRAQLETLLTGDIDDNGTWGPDSPPDWDGSDLDEAGPRHPDARFAYTWRNDGSSFYPGKLDWMFYTGSALNLQNHAVVETRTMTPATLGAYGLLAADTPTASDHAPVFADFQLGSEATGIAGGVPDSSPLRLLAAYPNPFRSRTQIRFELRRESAVELTVFDLAGREVRTVAAAALPAGSHALVWDGRDGAGRPAAAGVYLYSLRAGGGELAGRVTLLR